MRNLALLSALLFCINASAEFISVGGPAASGGGGGGTWGSITGTLSAQTDLQAAIDLKSTKALTANTQTASYTLVLTDADTKIVRMNVASANTLTVPTNATVAFPIGTVIQFSQVGAGQTTLTPDSGVTINAADSALKTRVQYSIGGIYKTATDTWTAFGDLTI